ncbi:hypothetical protein JXA48_00715 [Candidatus Woesearchaeota archaeon]|nr:hypothetical protein [Candidatus Woesearchaeota archaeon]
MSQDYYSDFTGQKYSKTDFIGLLTKRIKKDLRINNPLDMELNYCLHENGVKTQIISELLGNIFEKRLNLIIIPKNEDLIKDSILLDDSFLEEYVAKKTTVFFKGEEINKLKDDGVPVFRTITFEELKQLKNIFSIDGDLDNNSLEFVEKLNEEYSQTKSSFLKSFNYISKLLN